MTVLLPLTELEQRVNAATKVEPRATSELSPTSITAQTAVAVMEPEKFQAGFDVEPGPLTEKEAIEIVRTRVAEEAEYDLSEQTSIEELVETLLDAAEYRTSDVSISRLKEIVSEYAPNAPHGTVSNAPQQKAIPAYPSELTPLIQSGVAFRYYDHWFVKRCTKCGNFKTECCGPIEDVSAVRDDEKTFTAFGRQAVGLDPIKPPKPPKTAEEIQQDIIRKLPDNPWWNSFRGVDELEGNGTVKMYIENFLPEGATLICGLPKEGKSFLALSVAKALTSGRPLFERPGFEVPEIVPVLYLAAESGDGALKLRCEKMGITKDKTRFICRTLSQGLMLGLDDPQLETLVKQMRPVVILETLIRFNDGKDEDDATENRKLAQAIFRLIAVGARAVLGIHHSRKDLSKTNPTKEAAVRGSGDGLAMVDAVWLVMQDERLYQAGKGPNEINVVGWGRDFNPVPMRLGLTKKAPKDLATVKMFAPGIASCIDSRGDLEWVDRRIVFEQAQKSARSTEQTIEQAVTETPSISRKELAEKTQLSDWEVRKVLNRLGYHRGRGDNTATQWIKGPKEDSK